MSFYGIFKFLGYNQALEKLSVFAIKIKDRMGIVTDPRGNKQDDYLLEGIPQKASPLLEATLV